MRRVHRKGIGTMSALEQRRSNVATIAATRRAATHCKRGHEFTDENTDRRPDGTRECRTCNNDRRWYSRHGLRWAG